MFFLVPHKEKHYKHLYLDHHLCCRILLCMYAAWLKLESLEKEEM